MNCGDIPLIFIFSLIYLSMDIVIVVGAVDSVEKGGERDNSGKYRNSVRSAPTGGRFAREVILLSLWISWGEREWKKRSF